MNVFVEGLMKDVFSDIEQSTTSGDPFPTTIEKLIRTWAVDRQTAEDFVNDYLEQTGRTDLKEIAEIRRVLTSNRKYLRALAEEYTSLNIPVSTIDVKQIPAWSSSKAPVVFAFTGDAKKFDGMFEASNAKRIVPNNIDPSKRFYFNEKGNFWFVEDRGVAMEVANQLKSKGLEVKGI